MNLKSPADTALVAGDDGVVDDGIIELSELIRQDRTPADATDVHDEPAVHDDGLARPRKTPCASCPYRAHVDSGIWASEEYAKLPRYDKEMPEQPVAAFMCHQGDQSVCAGWLGHADPSQLLAVRIGIMRGHLHADCADYSTDVQLFPSGAAAAQHGLRDIRNPDGGAVKAIGKLVRLRGLTG